MENAWNAREREHETTLDLPPTIFSSSLGSLEAITKYLRESRGLTFGTIAALLNRDVRTIWGAYKSSTAKHPAPFAESSDVIALPVSLFTNRFFGMLEGIVWHLRHDLGMKYVHIAALTKRDQRTIWTTYRRAQHKMRSVHGS